MTPTSRRLQEPWENPPGVIAAINAYNRGERSTSDDVFTELEPSPLSPSTERSRKASASTPPPPLVSAARVMRDPTSQTQSPSTPVSVRDLKGLSPEESLARLRAHPRQSHHFRKDSVASELRAVHPAHREIEKSDSPFRNNAFAQEQAELEAGSPGSPTGQAKSRRVARPSSRDPDEIVRNSYQKSRDVTPSFFQSPSRPPPPPPIFSPNDQSSTPDSRPPTKNTEKLAQLMGKEYSLLGEDSPKDLTKEEQKTAKELLKDGKGTLSKDVQKALKKLGR